jgi:single-stranded-DNA-specific exonuclease
MTRYHASRTLKLDAPITCAFATSETISMLERAAPYGMGNPSPVLVLREARVLSCDVLKEQHLRLMVTDATGAKLKAMCFRAVGTALGDALMGARGKTLHMAGSLKQDVWQNRPQITFMVNDVMEG